MHTRSSRRSRHATRGIVSVEINVSREGANLSSRAALTYPMQTIMSSLTSTTPPLNMSAHGMIYITEIMGNNNCDSSGNNCTGIVVAQYRWNGGNYAPASRLWNCGSSGTNWATDGSCKASCITARSPMRSRRFICKPRCSVH
jgi:hypothetical protein